ncbi:MAG: imelysin family protein [Chitinophagales bacterium]
MNESKKTITVLFHNNQWRTFGLLLVFMGITFLLPSCGNKDDDSNSDDFDRQAMLENYADNLILPAYQHFEQKVDSLETVLNAFSNNPSTQALSLLQTTFLNTYRSWQNVELYEFGPAAEVILRSNVNTFPTDVFIIDNNISEGSYDLDIPSNIKAKGLPAMDYLLFGLGEDNTEILEYYTTDADAANRLQYLEDVFGDISTRTTSTIDKWDNYRSTFVGATGTDIGSSTSLLINEFNFEFELTKNPRIGIPLGAKSSGQALPGNVEAYYSGISKELALINLQNIVNVFRGKAFNSSQTGPSLESYLDQLGAEYRDGQSLSEAIIEQFEKDETALQAVPDPLSDAVISNESLVQTAFDEFVKTVVLIKTDMTSAIGIQITYQDNDGD